MSDSFHISAEVKSALNRGKPVVALESTVIAHGLPEGKGIEAARSMVQQIEKNGATAAIIAIIEGVVKVGLTDAEVERLASAKDVQKVSTRDIASTVVWKKDGATTVAATSFISASAGIPVMVTGGIGGIHLFACENWDISGDLWEMAKTPSLIVCSGAKSVLDLPATLEWMESFHIPVFGFGTEQFPAFYSRTSGLTVPCIDDEATVSEMYLARLSLGQRSAMVVGVPIPAEDEIDVSHEIAQAVAAAQSEGITGSSLTPWILSRVQELSDGKAVDANLALLANNAAVAARIAAELVGKQEKRIGFNASQ